MTYDEALEFVKNGNPVRRKHWDKDCQMMYDPSKGLFLYISSERKKYKIIDGDNKAKDWVYAP